MTQLIVVNDGQCRWGADEDVLTAYLDGHGWKYESGVWTEPRNDECPGSAYSLLCAAVPPVAGFGIDDPDWTVETGLMGEFTYRPDWGGWQFRSAPE